ncbi:unnamed protein product [Eruca vesicaria subsp. sativa]|uniref:Uncharacterized protein n=1 Tax=Eruca vesicaria subsp. sativa TaxID=29727 RepID=A0ABC8M0D0_ERUVS|nr:unnamed protein product [Eruca vesicaria subsp. sativa]
MMNLNSMHTTFRLQLSPAETAPEHCVTTPELADTSPTRKDLVRSEIENETPTQRHRQDGMALSQRESKHKAKGKEEVAPGDGKRCHVPPDVKGYSNRVEV